MQSLLPLSQPVFLCLELLLASQQRGPIRRLSGFQLLRKLAYLSLQPGLLLLLCLALPGRRFKRFLQSLFLLFHLLSLLLRLLERTEGETAA